MIEYISMLIIMLYKSQPYINKRQERRDILQVIHSILILPDSQDLAKNV